LEKSENWKKLGRAPGAQGKVTLRDRRARNF